jgi:hypothetical protein
MANINKALGTDLASIAELLRSKGRGKDTMLAHITPKEAALLKRRGGSGSINPETGLPEFEDSGSYDYSPPEPVSPTYDVVNQQGQFTPTQADTGVPVQVESSYTPGGDAYAPVGPSGNLQSADILNQYGQTTPYVAGQTTMQQTGPAFPTVTSAPSPTAPGVVTPDGAPDGGKNLWDKLKSSMPGDKTTDFLTRLGLTGALGAFGASQARKAGTQTQAATQQQQALAQPYQTQGQNLIAQAQQGSLTPASKQAYDVAKAQLAQGQANRGGVGSQQSANQLATIYQSLLDNQYNYGLKVMQIGDNIAMGAIKSGLQMDQQLNIATTNFYSQLANYVAGGNMQAPQQSPIQAQVGT